MHDLQARYNLKPARNLGQTCHHADGFSLGQRVKLYVPESLYSTGPNLDASWISIVVRQVSLHACVAVDGPRAVRFFPNVLAP